MPVTQKQSGRRLTHARRDPGDEGKPRCRNCIDRNFQFQYGPYLTFLTKNAHTVESAEVESTPNSYQTIRFVNEEHQIEDNDPEGSQILSAGQASVPTWSSHEPGQKAAELLQADEPVADSTPQPTPTGISHNDESAVAGLLALGTSTNEMAMPRLSLSDFGAAKTGHSTQAWTPIIPDAHTILASGSTRDDVSPTEALELLRHYRYEVAACLDICDLGQNFGIQGLQLAMQSQPVWNSILKLSRTSNNSLHSQEVDNENDGTISSGIQEDYTEVALLLVFSAVTQYTANISTAWKTRKDTYLHIRRRLCHHTTGRSLDASIYWLFLRLDVGAALALDTNINTHLPPSPPYTPDSSFEADPFGEVFCFAQRPLWLCGSCPPLHLWMHLVEELEKWYRERPRGFQPMMELGINGHSTGVFINQLYHTSMLLLLHNRPRTAPITDIQSTTMSPLWHAQRVCSIALNNDSRECWDTCLLASFLMASRRMTHEAQQQEVLRGFHRIQEITGWGANDFLQGLQEEWRFLET
ncbi:hypothetical protein N7512_002136 [Penicillium capsulatum]|nr:hypothetical protein N7512_002136 [Penicillium capsulatum]